MVCGFDVPIFIAQDRGYLGAKFSTILIKVGNSVVRAVLSGAKEWGRRTRGWDGLRPISGGLESFRWRGLRRIARPLGLIMDALRSPTFSWGLCTADLFRRPRWRVLPSRILQVYPTYLYPDEASSPVRTNTEAIYGLHPLIYDQKVPIVYFSGLLSQLGRSRGLDSPGFIIVVAESTFDPGKPALPRTSKCS